MKTAPNEVKEMPIDVKTEFAEIAARCEQAAGPNRHLNVQIYILLDPDAQHIIGEKPGRFPREAIYGPRSSFWDWALNEEASPPEFDAIPDYTASFDATMTLAPVGARRMELGTYAEGGSWAYFHGPDDTVHEAEAATEVLALLAAILRAHTQQQ